MDSIVPEFGVVVGIEGEAYHVKSFKEVLQQPQPAIAYDETEPPGGVYALGFPAEAECEVQAMARLTDITKIQARRPPA